MTWLYFSLLGYLGNALNGVVDKILLAKVIRNPLVYTMFIGILGSVVILALPFVRLPAGPLLLESLLTGVVFTLALILFLKALQLGEPGRIIPLLGALIPLLSLTLSWWLFNRPLPNGVVGPFVLLLGGGIVLAWPSGLKRQTAWWQDLSLALLAALFFGLFYSLTKDIYSQQRFVDGFVLARLGSVLAVLFLLLVPENRQALLNTARHLKTKTGWLFLGNQAIGAVGFALIDYSVSLAPHVALVNALQGTQYVFLVALVLLLAKRYPQLLATKLNLPIVLTKGLAIIVIIVGLGWLAKLTV